MMRPHRTFNDPIIVNFYELLPARILQLPLGTQISRLNQKNFREICHLWNAVKTECPMNNQPFPFLIVLNFRLNLLMRITEGSAGPQYVYC